MVDTDTLLLRISQGDHSACEPLLARHETKLRQTIAVRMDRRASARFGVSDVLQEALTIAIQRLPQYAAARPVAFYLGCDRLPWSG